MANATTGLAPFERRHGYLVCVNSGGCAMDSVAIRHSCCLGPALVEQWDLRRWSTPVLALWNDINQYSMTRGCDPFKALDLALQEVDAKYTPIAGIGELTAWVNSGVPRNEDTLGVAAARGHSGILPKALAWWRTAKADIDSLPADRLPPFPHVEEGLAAASEFADVVVISGTGRFIVTSLWSCWGLMRYVGAMMARDCGDTASCVAAMLRFGYAPEHVLLVGDTPGDREAAARNGVRFFPIAVRHEGECWRDLRQEGFARLRDGSYPAYEAERVAAFHRNLGA